MAIFNSYVSLPEGNKYRWFQNWWHQQLIMDTSHELPFDRGEIPEIHGVKVVPQ